MERISRAARTAALLEQLRKLDDAGITDCVVEHTRRGLFVVGKDRDGRWVSTTVPGGIGDPTLTVRLQRMRLDAVARGI